MTKKQKVTGFVALSLLVLLAGLLVWYFRFDEGNRGDSRLGIQGDRDRTERPFSFIDQDSEMVTQKDLKGKIVVVEYFYTTCKSICPIMNENMDKVYQAFRNSDDVLILSHTVDPEDDSVPALKAYSERFNADARIWKFLTGDKKALYDQARQNYAIGVTDSTTDIDEDFIHSNQFVLLDKEGRMRTHLDKDGNALAYDGTNAKSVAGLIDDIRYLQKKGE